MICWCEERKEGRKREEKGWLFKIISVPPTASDTDSPNNTHITSLCTTHSFRHWLTKQHSHHQSLYHPQFPTLTHQTALTSPVSVPPTVSDTDSPNSTHITSLCTTYSFWHWLTKQHSHHQSLYHPQFLTLTHQTTLKSPVSVPPIASDTDSPNSTHITSLCTTHSFRHWFTKQHAHHQSLYHPQFPTLTHQTALTSPVSVPPTVSDIDSPNNTHITSLCTTTVAWHSSPLTDYLKLASNWISTSSQDTYRVTPGQFILAEG